MRPPQSQGQAVLAASPSTYSIEGFGTHPQLQPVCLRSGVTVVGSGRATFCFDVNGTRADGSKLVVDVSESRPVDLVRLGEERYARALSNASVGAIIEVKRFQQSCEVCETCACIDCGQHCGYSCNAVCRLSTGRRCQGGLCRCPHTVGVLDPGRWYVSVDATGSFSLQATLVAATQLRVGHAVQRTLLAVGMDKLGFAPTEGVAWTDYLYVDPAFHEALTIDVSQLRAGSDLSSVEVLLHGHRSPPLRHSQPSPAAHTHRYIPPSPFVGVPEVWRLAYHAAA